MVFRIENVFAKHEICTVASSDENVKLIDDMCDLLFKLKVVDIIYIIDGKYY